MAAKLWIEERELGGGRRLGAEELAHGLVELLGLREVAYVTGLRNHDELRAHPSAVAVEFSCEKARRTPCAESCVAPRCR